MRDQNFDIENLIRFAAANGTSEMMDLYGDSRLTQMQASSEDSRSEVNQASEESKRQESRRVGVDEYQLLLMIQQQSQIQQRYLASQGRLGPQGQQLVTPKAILDALPERIITSDFIFKHTDSPDKEGD